MGVGVLKWCTAGVFCCLILAQVASTVPTPPDYDAALSDMYDLLSHGVERRGGGGGPPSMRLRFGKRGGGSIRSWQQVSQRSEPSLRLRYGKRTVDEAEPLLDHDLVRKDRTPALRLRFGKRTSSDYLQDDAYDAADFIRQDRAPALRLRFGKRDVSYGQDEEASTGSHEQ
ncbi:short neuropeptide F-like isoform X1 [Macrobrachium rosenbergii]|uniref:short neuropeptide F-like isoform X1 n=1 Tax=Macrobrachium rosenbergii TaxID=79674 RepID=UPI0034D3FBE5